MENTYTLVIETPAETLTYDFNDLDTAVTAMRSEKERYFDDCNLYIIDDYGNILNIN